MSLNVSVRFAVDRDGSHTVQPEEIVSRVEDLAALDRDGNGRIEGDELRSLYFEYGEDRWLQAGRTYREASQGWITEVRLEGVQLDPPRVDLNVSFRPR